MIAYARSVAVIRCATVAGCLAVLQSVATQAEAKPQLRAGAATADITPAAGVSLDGPIAKNGSVVGVHDRLHARALVLDDGTTRLALVICDACLIGASVFDEAKATVHRETGLPP